MPPAAELFVVFPTRIAGPSPLGVGETVLGRRPDAPRGLRLNDPTLSRRHLAASFDPASGTHRARDLGGRNGSRLGGGTLGPEPVPLRDGDIVRMGDVLAVYHVPASRAPAADAPASRDAVAGASSASRDAVPGGSPAALALRRQIALAAVDPLPALLVGEAGTGQRTVAAELHRLSGRGGPLLSLHCGVRDAALFERLLFGVAPRSASDAPPWERGLWQLGADGTLVLEEVAELPREAQARLARALARTAADAVAAARDASPPVRVIATSCRDRAALIAPTGLRPDLHAYLGLWELPIPPLRERRADLLAWVERFARAYYAERALAPLPTRLDADAAERLLLHDWPENLRELERLVAHAHRHRGGTLDAALLDEGRVAPACAAARVRGEGA